MVIAVAATSSDPHSEIGSRFCTSPCFHLMDTITKEIEIINNCNPAGEMCDVETKAADIVINKKARLVVTDQCGAIAYRSLCAAGIQVLGAVHGKVSKVLDTSILRDDDNIVSPNAEPWWNWR